MLLSSSFSEYSQHMSASRRMQAGQLHDVNNANVARAITKKINASRFQPTDGFPRRSRL